MGNLDHLGSGIHIGVDAARFQLERFGSGQRTRVQFIVVKVETRQRTDHIGLALIVGMFGGRMGNNMLIGHAAICFNRPGTPLTAGNRITNKAILIFGGERHEFGIALEGGHR